MNESNGLSDGLRARIASYDRRDVLQWTLLGLFVLLVLPFVVFAVPQVVGAEHSYVVLSGSMEPAISSGDVVVVNEVRPAQIEEGDVITFGGSQSEPTTTHRVIGIEEQDGERVFRTKGDNNEDADPSPVRPSSVSGRVMKLPLPVLGSTLFVIPYVGYVVEFAGTTVGFALLVVAPVTLLVATELWSAVARRRRDESGDAAGDGTATQSTGDGGTEAETAVTLSPRQMGGVAGILVVVTVAAGWRAYETMHPLAVGVLVAAVSALLLLASVSVLGDNRRQATTDGGSVSAGTAGPGGRSPGDVVQGSVSSCLYRRRRVEIDSFETLRAMAVEKGTWLVHDESRAAYVLFGDGVAYVVTVEQSGPADRRDDRDSTVDPEGDSRTAGSADPGAGADGSSNDGGSLSDSPRSDPSETGRTETSTGHGREFGGPEDGGDDLAAKDLVRDALDESEDDGSC
ncbi:signal peptidase I [Halosimplex amylolyticum]|uniref:signal peptidase I n=1 Tax=Halosimplex amylolyticum TaxID=3396616 RepID=UPI003F56215D